MSIRQNIALIRDNITKSAAAINREPSSIRLICVTKNIPTEKIIEVISSGVSEIAENRIQEAKKKFGEISSVYSHAKWHFIGHLQTNKAKPAVEMFELIHSLDSVHLAEEINKQARKMGKIQDCLIEVKVSEEESKYGCPPENIGDLIQNCVKLENIRLCGLMAIAPFFENPENARPYFRRAKEIFDDVLLTLNLEPSTFNLLSMGMSNDYNIAVEEGANMVRIGSAIFTENNQE